MSTLRVSLFWGEDVISTETIQRAESRALVVLTEGKASPEAAKSGYDLWKRRKLGDPLPKAEIKRLYDLWVAAEQAAEAVLEEGLSDGRLVCAELALS